MPALFVQGITFSDQGVPVEYSRTFVRSDRTRYFVERIVRISRDQRRQSGAGRSPTPTEIAVATLPTTQ